MTRTARMADAVGLACGSKEMEKMANREQGVQFVERLLVLLEDLAPHVGGSWANAKVFAEENGVSLHQDWAGRFGVTPTDAHRLKIKREQILAESQRKQDAYNAWTERRKAEHQRKLEEQAAREAEQREAEIAQAQEEHRETIRRRLEREAAELAARRAAGAQEPDLSNAAFEREGGAP